MARSFKVTLPCQVGDEVWGFRIYRGAVIIKRGFVHQMYFVEGMRLCICVKQVCRGEWGKNIFPTYEAAVAALKAKEGGSDA